MKKNEIDNERDVANRIFNEEISLFSKEDQVTLNENKIYCLNKIVEFQVRGKQNSSTLKHCLSIIKYV